MHYLVQHPLIVGQLLAQHLGITAASLGLALAIAVPLGIAVARRRELRLPILGALGTIYTIPSLALFALLIPLLGLGWRNAVIALAAYAQMILVRNIAAGINGVDPAAVDAARGMGMSPWQMFWRVERPLAMPVALGGVRIALVSIIGIANVAAWINAGGLGTLMFAGIYQDNPQKIIAGALASAALAIAADAVLRGLERRYRRHLAS